MIDRSIRHVLAVLMVCFVVLFAQLNRLQFFQAEALKANPANSRQIVRDFNQVRGNIVTRDGTVVARSVAVFNGPFDRLREYPEGELYGHVTGYLSFTIGSAGIERTQNDNLTGRSSALSGLDDLFGSTPDVGNVTLTINHRLQSVAREALADREGSVVVLDPKTGQILALFSNPTFDPNVLSAHNTTEVNTSWTFLVNAPGNPLRASTFQEIYFPGSTFKIVTAASALENELATLSEPEFAASSSYAAPLTVNELQNSSGSTCGGNLVNMIQVSCNTAFAELGAEIVGPQRLLETAGDFGFNSVPPLDLEGAEASSFPIDFGELVQEATPEMPAGLWERTPNVAQMAIGQSDVSATPLQMALVAAAVANNGQVMAPHVVLDIKNSGGKRVSRTEPEIWKSAMSADTASDLRQAMVSAATDGTGRSALVTGVEVGAKTGTAQLGTTPPRSHAWTIAFAGEPGRDPELAIAVLVKASPDRPDQGGGRTAAPIVADLIREFYGV